MYLYVVLTILAVCLAIGVCIFFAYLAFCVLRYIIDAKMEKMTDENQLIRGQFDDYKKETDKKFDQKDRQIVILNQQLVKMDKKVDQIPKKRPGVIAPVRSVANGYKQPPQPRNSLNLIENLFMSKKNDPPKSL